jgi:hypothetical protein
MIVVRVLSKVKQLFDLRNSFVPLSCMPYANITVLEVQNVGFGTRFAAAAAVVTSDRVCTAPLGGAVVERRC